MDADKTGQPKIERPHAFFDKPQEVVIDPALSKEQKKEVLDALEQDARQLSVASAEGMTGGEPSKLHDVLDAGDSLALPPTAYAYAVVLKDLRSRLTTDVTDDARAVLERALGACPRIANSVDPNGGFVSSADKAACSDSWQHHLCPSGVELQQIMDGADHSPLPSDLFKTAEEELPEASGRFLLSEDRLDHLFA
jgi:hypothetical protein